jgi:phosphohistidine phosphatase
MKVHLIRHAEAIERSPNVTEEHRFLTCRGRSRFRRVASSLKKLGIEPDIILTSPLIRSVQTADILAECIRHCGDVLVTPQLAPGFQLQLLQDLMSMYPHANEIVLVGHEPDFGEIISTLLEIGSPCNLKKGGLVSFRIPAGKTHIAAKFIQLVTGGGKVIASRGKALDRLQNS